MCIFGRLIINSLQVEESLRLKEKGLATEVVAVTMGPAGNKVIS
jgi:electron transfer flavoprotein alpha/beta subunit